MKHIELKNENFLEDMLGAEENFALEIDFVATVVCHTKDKIIYESQNKDLYYMEYPYPEDYDIGTTADVTTLYPIYELSKKEQALIKHILNRI